MTHPVDCTTVTCAWSVRIFLQYIKRAMYVVGIQVVLNKQRNLSPVNSFTNITLPQVSVHSHQPLPSGSAPFPQSEHTPPPASLILPIQTRGRSRTPVILLQSDAGQSFLSPAVSPSAAGSGPITCLRSRSLSKNPLD